MEAAMAENKMAQECAVCVERYRDPRILECAHHFCKVCLEEIAERHPQGYTTCPICRHVTKTDDVSSLPRYRIVNDFTQNVSDLVDSNKKHGISKAICEICKDETSNASKVCFKCNVKLCDSCSKKKHAHFSGIQGHTLFNLSEGMFCSAHAGTHIILHCKTCSAPCCPMCAMDQHCGHELVDIEEAGVKFKLELKETIWDMDKNAAENDVLMKIQETLNGAKDSRDKFTVFVTELKRKIKLLTERAEALESEYNAKSCAAIKSLDMAAADLQSYIDSKAKLRDHFEYLAETASPHEMLSRRSECPPYNPVFYKEIIAQEKIQIPKFEDIPGQKLTALLAEAAEMLGSCVTNKMFTPLVEIPEPEPILRVIHQSTFNTGSEITGAVADEKRKRLIIRRICADAPISVYDYHGNLQHILGKNVSECQSGDHQNLTIDTKRDMYILPSSTGQLMIMSLDGAVRDRIAVCDNALNGVSYSEKEDMYVTSSQDEVYLIDANTKTVTINIFAESVYHVTAANFLINGSFKTHVFASCHNRHCVRVFDVGGSEVDVFGTPRTIGSKNIMHCPWDVVAGPGGQILISDRGNKRVLAIHKDRNGRHVNKLVDLGTCSFSVLGYDYNDRILFVCDWGGQVIVYKDATICPK